MTRYIVIDVAFSDGNGFTSIFEESSDVAETSERYSKHMAACLEAGKKYIETGEGPPEDEDVRLLANQEPAGNA